MTQWWSDSRGGYIPLAKMHPKQLANGLKKLRQGDYSPPGDPLSVDEETRLGVEMEAELERRGLDLNGNEVVPEHTDADAPPQDTEAL